MVKKVVLDSVSSLVGHCMVNVILNISKDKLKSKFITYGSIKDMNVRNFNLDLD